MLNIGSTLFKFIIVLKTNKKTKNCRETKRCLSRFIFQLLWSVFIYQFQNKLTHSFYLNVFFGHDFIIELKFPQRMKKKKKNI